MVSLPLFSTYRGLRRKLESNSSLKQIMAGQEEMVLNYKRGDLD